MAVHKANLDRLAATGLPIQITELDIDGVAAGGVPGDEVQLRNYRRIVPIFWEHPAVEGITVWGWRQPNHWRNAQNAPIVLSTDMPKPAAHWLSNYVRGIAPVDPAGPELRDQRRQRQPVGTVAATTGPRRSAGPNLRTFTWRITGGAGAAASPSPRAPASSHRGPAAARRAHDVPLKVRVSDGFHESAETDVTSSPGTSRTSSTARRRHRSRDAVAVARRQRGLRCVHAGRRPGLRGERRRDRDQHGGRRGADGRRPGERDAGQAGQRRVLARAAGPGRGRGRVRPGQRLAADAARYSGPVSNDPLTIRFKQAIGASEPLRTGPYSKTFTFTLSTTAP